MNGLKLPARPLALIASFLARHVCLRVGIKESRQDGNTVATFGDQRYIVRVVKKYTDNKNVMTPWVTMERMEEGIEADGWLDGQEPPRHTDRTNAYDGHLRISAVEVWSETGEWRVIVGASRIVTGKPLQYRIYDGATGELLDGLSSTSQLRPIWRGPPAAPIYTWPNAAMPLYAWAPCYETPSPSPSPLSSPAPSGYILLITGVGGLRPRLVWLRLRDMAVVRKLAISPHVLPDFTASEFSMFTHPDDPAAAHFLSNREEIKRVSLTTGELLTDIGLDDSCGWRALKIPLGKDRWLGVNDDGVMLIETREGDQGAVSVAPIRGLHSVPCIAVCQLGGGKQLLTCDPDASCFRLWEMDVRDAAMGWRAELLAPLGYTQIASCPIPSPVPCFDEYYEEEELFELRQRFMPAGNRRVGPDPQQSLSAVFTVEGRPLCIVEVVMTPGRQTTLNARPVPLRSYAHRTVPCPAFAVVAAQIRRQQERRLME
jgi:hypothetical protein